MGQEHRPPTSQIHQVLSQSAVRSPANQGSGRDVVLRRSSARRSRTFRGFAANIRGRWGGRPVGVEWREGADEGGGVGDTVKGRRWRWLKVKLRRVKLWGEEQRPMQCWPTLASEVWSYYGASNWRYRAVFVVRYNSIWHGQSLSKTLTALSNILNCVG